MTKPNPFYARPSAGWIVVEGEQQQIGAPNALTGFGRLAVTGADADHAA
jgi:hypothetical protein